MGWIFYITYSKSKDQPGKVANPARGQLTGKTTISLVAFAPENLVSASAVLQIVLGFRKSGDESRRSFENL